MIVFLTYPQLIFVRLTVENLSKDFHYSINDKFLFLQRYRKQGDSSSSDSEDNYEPYIPVKERKKSQYEMLKLGRVTQVRIRSVEKKESEILKRNSFYVFSTISKKFLSF